MTIIDLILMISAIVAFAYVGTKEFQGLVVVFVFMMLMKSVPTAGGNSTAGLLAMVFLGSFTIFVFGPFIIRAWMNTVDVTATMHKAVILEKEKVEITHTIFYVTDWLTRSVTDTITFALTLTTWTGYFRCLIGYMFVFYMAFDAWFGPAAQIEPIFSLMIKKREMIDALTLKRLLSTQDL